MTLLQYSLILYSAIQLNHGYKCTNGDDMTCSLGGKCINNRCECDPTWKGENCEMLDLLPSNTYKAFYRSYESSWGGSVIYSSKDNLYHMFTSDMSENCTLAQWQTNSRVIHVTSSSPNGPYEYNGHNITIPRWSHQPTVHYIPTEQKYIIYHVGWANQTTGSVNCTANQSQSILPSNEPYESGKAYPNDNNTFPNRAVSVSTDLFGNWNQYKSSHQDNEWMCPQVYVYPNGSILYIRCRDQCLDETLGNGSNICFSVNFAESYTEPLQHVAKTNVYGEDGYLFRDIHGYFHMIYHTIYIGPRTPSHAYSPNGIDWKIATTNLSNEAFPFYYTLLNGTKIELARRERTQILLDQNGFPSYIFNGVERKGDDEKTQFTFTGVQTINTSHS